MIVHRERMYACDGNETWLSSISYWLVSTTGISILDMYY